jgi:spermidine/putrescine transport system substrate-binding protein
MDIAPRPAAGRGEREVLGPRITRRDLLRRGARAGSGLLLGGAAVAATACSSSASVSAADSGASFAPIQPTPDGDLNYLTWAGFIDPTIVRGFEEAYGVAVHQTFFDNDDAMVTALASGAAYDVVTTNSAYMEPLLQGGLLQPIDHQGLRNFAQVIPFFRDPPFDPGARYSMPYAYGPTGIAWNAGKVRGMTGSWNDLWSHPGAAGRIFVLDQIEEALGMSLLRLGFDLNSADPAQVRDAADELIALKPELGGFSTDDATNLADGSAWVQHAWSGDVWRAMASSSHPEALRFQLNDEGVPLGSDQMSIASSAEHPGTALLFIDWLLQPDRSIRNVEWIGYPNGTGAGNAALDRSLRRAPFLRVDEATLARADWKRALTGERKRLWTQEWARVQAA